MKEPSPPALVVIVTVIATLVGVLYIGSGVSLVIGYFFVGFGSWFAIAGPLILALGGLDILAGIKFYRADRSSWALVIASSTLSGLASFLRFGSQGVGFSLVSGLGSYVIIFPVMVVYSYTQNSVVFYFQSVDQERQRIQELEEQMRKLDREYMSGKLSKDDYADKLVHLRRARIEFQDDPHRQA